MDTFFCSIRFNHVALNIAWSRLPINNFILPFFNFPSNLIKIPREKYVHTNAIRLHTKVIYLEVIHLHGFFLNYDTLFTECIQEMMLLNVPEIHLTLVIQNVIVTYIFVKYYQLIVINKCCLSFSTIKLQNVFNCKMFTFLLLLCSF